MKKSKTGINIMDLLAKSVAKINAMEDKDVKKSNLESKLPSTEMSPEVASIVYNYLRGVSPTIASSLLDIHPKIDKNYDITLEEVVQEWKIKEGTVVVQSIIKFKDEDKKRKRLNKSIQASRRLKDDNSEASHTEEIRDCHLISDNDINMAETSKDVKYGKPGTYYDER